MGWLIEQELPWLMLSAVLGFVLTALFMLHREIDPASIPSVEVAPEPVVRREPVAPSVESPWSTAARLAARAENTDIEVPAAASPEPLPAEEPAAPVAPATTAGRRLFGRKQSTPPPPSVPVETPGEPAAFEPEPIDLDQRIAASTGSASAVVPDAGPSTEEIAEQERLEAERVEAERVEAERLEAERVEAERAEAERAEAERLEAERAEAAKAEAAAEKAAAAAAKKAAAAQAKAEKAEADRLEAERLEAARLEVEQAAAAQAEAEQAEADRIEAERAEAERLEAEQAAQADAERAEADRIEAERAEAERAEAERLEAERLEAERLEAERLEAERLEAERLDAERAEAERAEAERAEAERAEAERAEAERAEAERAEAERVEAERAEAERLEAERAEAERAEAERLEAERAASAVEPELDPQATAFATLEELAALTGDDEPDDQAAESAHGEPEHRKGLFRRKHRASEDDFDPEPMALTEAAHPTPSVEPIPEPADAPVDLFAAYTINKAPTPPAREPIVERAPEPVVEEPVEPPVEEILDAEPAAFDETPVETHSYSDNGLGLGSGTGLVLFDPESHTPYGPGSLAPRLDGSTPRGYPIKGNRDTMLFHTEASRWFSRIQADVWFESEEAAREAGFTRWDQRATQAHNLRGPTT